MILRIAYSITHAQGFRCEASFACGLSRKTTQHIGVLQFSDHLQWLAFREAVKSLPLFTVQLVESK